MITGQLDVPRIRPIPFRGEMICGILADRKTQTRRLVTPQPELGDHGWQWPSNIARSMVEIRDMASLGPYGRRGDKLWVRETWRSLRQVCNHDDQEPCDEHCDQTYVAYRATPRVGYRPIPDRQRITYLDESTPLERNRELLGPWKSPRFMPRWASRITLEIVNVRVQRLQDITDDDARAEGVEPYTPPAGHVSPEPHRIPFADLWDSINGKRRRRRWDSVSEQWRVVIDESARWELNPWVWAITFRRLRDHLGRDMNAGD